MPDDKDVANFLARLDDEGEDLVRESLMMVIYGEENAWQNKRARLWLAKKDHEREDDVQQKLDANAADLLDVEERGAKWSRRTALFTGVIAVFTGIIAVVAFVRWLNE